MRTLSVILPSRTPRAYCSSALNTPAGGWSLCVVMNSSRLSGFGISPPRIWPITRLA